MLYNIFLDISQLYSFYSGKKKTDAAKMAVVPSSFHSDSVESSSDIHEQGQYN